MQNRAANRQQPTTSARPRCAALLVLLALQLPQRATAAEASAAAQYEQARKNFYALKHDPQRQRFRHHWISVISEFRQVARAHPQSPEAARATYTAGELWRGLYDVSRRASDLDQAMFAYEIVVERYGPTSLADDALYKRAELLLRRGHSDSAHDELQRLVEEFPKGDMVKAAHALAIEMGQPLTRASRAKSRPKPAAAAEQLVGQRDSEAARAIITEVKHWSDTDYTRVSIYVDGQVQARSADLPGDPTTDTPRRVYIDLTSATLPDSVPGRIALEQGLINAVRIAQFAPDTVRVVLTPKSAGAKYRVVAMTNPVRIVIDIIDEAATAPAPSPALNADAAPTQTSAKTKPAAAPPPEAVRVVIDPGHGGHDVGAIGPDKLYEKDVVLAIARDTAAALNKAGIKATLTRSDDRFLALEERTAVANGSNAALFVSIHANSAADKRAHGIETYYLDVTNDRYALRLAAVENKISEEEVGDLQLILADLTTKANTADSMALAKRAQSKMVKAARAHKKDARDLGVKGSLFYVLLGARMPAILVEAAFLSHPLESKLLSEEGYRNDIGDALATAIKEYLANANKGEQRP